MEVEPIDTGEGVTDDQEAEMAVTKKETGTPGAATVGSSEEGRPFICGVVEGFYNRPWTQNQRVDLYKKLNTFGLNAYLYGESVKFTTVYVLHTNVIYLCKSEKSTLCIRKVTFRSSASGILLIASVKRC